MKRLKKKLSKEVSALEASKMTVAYDSDYAKYKADIEKYFSDVPGPYCLGKILQAYRISG